MLLATRGDLEAVIGVRAIEDLLNVAVDADDNAEEAEAARQRRLNTALRAGNNLISQFITVPRPENASDVLRQFAVEEAIYHLYKHAGAGASTDMIDAANQRRTDLAMMRKRDQMPGKPEGQASHRPRVVESQGRYTTAVKRRIY